MREKAADVCGSEAEHEVGEFAVVSGPEDEVPVVGHEAVGEDAYGEDLAGLVEGLEEGLVIGGFVEDALAGVAAVEDMVDDVARGDACGT
jgi:hypothetical protein